MKPNRFNNSITNLVVIIFLLLKSSKVVRLGRIAHQFKRKNDLILVADQWTWKKLGSIRVFLKKLAWWKN